MKWRRFGDCWLLIQLCSIVIVVVVIVVDSVATSVKVVGGRAVVVVWPREISKAVTVQTERLTGS